MSYDPYGNDSKPSWLQRFGPKIGIGAGFGAVGFLLGRSFAVPGTTAFWDLAAQPAATVTAGVGAITAGYLAFHNGEKGRGLDGQHHRETMNRDRESNLQERYTAAAKQLGDDNSAIREAGAYAIAALVDDWLRHGTLIPQPGHAHSQAKTCVHLLCSYLRANRRLDKDFADRFTPEEAAVRASIIGVLRERTGTWAEREQPWIDEKKLTEENRITIDLHGASLVNADFYKANLRRAYLVDANLSGAQLQDTQLQFAALNNTNLTNAWMKHSNLTGAQLIGTNFTNIFADDAIFCSATMMQTIFVDAQLSYANFSLPEPEDEVESMLANLRSSFWATDFSGASLDGTDFTRCGIEFQAIFDGRTTYSESTKWPGDFKPEKGKQVPSQRTPR